VTTSALLLALLAAAPVPRPMPAHHQGRTGLEAVLLDAIAAADLGSLLDAGWDPEPCPTAPFCPLELSPSGAVPHLDLAVIELDARGRAVDAAEVIVDPGAPRGMAVALDGDLAPRGVRFRKWSLERREAPRGGRPFTDADDIGRAPGQVPGGRDFMVPYPASVFKLLLAFHVARDVAAGDFSWHDWVPESVAPDAVERPVWDLLDAMLTRSDNVATKALLRWMHGWDEVAEMNVELATLGLPTLRVDGTRPEDGARWMPGEIHAGAMDLAKLLWLVAGGPGVHWRTPGGRLVTARDLPEPARELLGALLADQGRHDVLSTGSLCGLVPPGIPAVVPERWIDPVTGGEPEVDPIFRRDVRPCNAKAEVRFLHKTGVTWNYVADAGIVESLPGAPCRRYVIALVASAGTRFLDPERAGAGVHPCAVDGTCVSRRLAEIGRRIDGWMTGASARGRSGAGCASQP
jgi:hypothetical protein